jgi:hypothetical protein
MALPRLYKRLIGALLAIVALVLPSFAVLMIWVVTGPRSLDMFTPYIESALAPPGGGYKVKIGNSLLIWDGWQHPVGIRLRNVDLSDGKGAAIAHFPEVGVRMYFFELLIGKVDLKSIELLNPTAQLVQDEKGNVVSFSFRGGGADTTEPIAGALMLLTSETGDNLITHLKSFTIKHASLSMNDSHGKPFLTSVDAGLEIKRKQGTATGKLTVPLRFGGNNGEIEIDLSIDGNKKTVSSDVIFGNVPSAVLHALAPSQPWMEGVKVPLSGTAHLTSDFNADIDAIDFILETGSGAIDFPGQFEKELHPKHIKVVGSLSDHLRTFTVKDGVLDFKDYSLAFRGVGHREGDDYGVDAYAETEKVAIDKIAEYWPLKLAPHSRNWVVTRVSKGAMAKATVNLHFKPGDFALRNTPEEAVESTITVKGATVQYKPDHPPVTDVDGVIKFTGRTMDAKITSARYMDGTKISAGRLRFPDFYPDDVQLTIDMDVNAPAKDMQRFLSLPDLNKAVKLGLTPEVTGQVKGNAKLDFIAFSENDKNDVSATGRINYAVKGELVDVSQKRFLGNRDVSGANMTLTLDNKGIKAAGKARINGIPMAIDLSTNFEKDNPTTYAIKADMPILKLPEFGLPKLTFAQGVLGVNATFFTSDKADKADATLDLTHAAIALPQHGFMKKEGEKATLKLTTENQPGGDTLIKSFHLKGPGYDTAGEALYNKAMADFSRFSFSPMLLGKHDLDSLTYSREGNTILLAAKGKSFDATPYLADTSQRNQDLGFVIDLRTNLLIMGNGRMMKNITMQVDCPADHCNSASINATLKDGTPFYYTIANGKLSSSCDNAGELARVFAIFDTIENGKMSMKGEYKNGRLEGDLEVKGYTLRNAPVVTKIFTVASLTGILDTLVGNGIYFDRLSAPFIFHKGNLILKGAKTHGSALGFTADGVIDSNKSVMDLTGMLVPSYTANSLIGNIPLLGNLLVGKGGGLIALTYGMHGSIKDPSVVVNPLSVLTPGFLRGIFDIFDKPAPDMDSIEAAQKKAAAAAVKDGAVAPEKAPDVVLQQAPGQTQVAPPQPGASKLPSVDELK